MKFKRFHIPIMGFTQSADTETGIERLWKRMRDELPLSAQQCVIEPKVWNENFGRLAEFIHRHIDNDGVVNIYAYSWGVGHGARTLSRQLHKRGIQVAELVACDPVFHSLLRPWRGVFPAIWNGPIVFPENVWRARSLIQRQNTPQGTGLKLLQPIGVVDDPVHLNYNHQYIDDAVEFHDLAMQVAIAGANTDAKKIKGKAK
jgi:hypothetical protein